MKKLFAMVLILALALSLTACGSKPSEEDIQAYEAIQNARARYEQIQQEMFQVAQMVKEDPDKVLEESYAYLSQDLDLSEMELRLGACRFFKGDEWDLMSQEEKELMAAVAEVGMMIFNDPAFGENGLAKFCVGAVDSAYRENGVRFSIELELSEIVKMLEARKDPVSRQLREYADALLKYMQDTAGDNLDDYTADGELIRSYTEELNKLSRPLEEIFGK